MSPPLFRGDPAVAEQQRTINEWLATQGMKPLKVDGIPGEKTAAAYELMLMRSDAGGVDNPMPVPSAAKPWWLSIAMNGSLAGLFSSLGGLVWWWFNKDQTEILTTSLAGLVSSLTTLFGTLKRMAPIDQTLVARWGVADLRLPSRLQPPELSPPRRRGIPEPDSGFVGPQD